MQKPYIIFTDDGGDIPKEFLKSYNLGIGTMHCGFDDTDYNYVYNDEANYSQFYSKLRDGYTAVTTPLSPDEYVEELSSYMKRGLDILYISFSSYLSGAYTNLCAAKAILKEKYPSQSLITVDSKRASAAITLMVKTALDMQLDGKTLGEVYQWLERYKLSFNGLFMIDDIFYIVNESERGSVNDAENGFNLSSTLVHLAMLANIKPILNINNTGKIGISETPTGRKKAIDHICSLVKKKAYSPESSVAYICHGDCLEDAQKLKEKLAAQVKFKDIVILLANPLIGAHMGADILGISYIGEG